MSGSWGHPTEIVDVRALCRSFPALPEPCIDRPDIIAEIEDLFAKGMKLVTVEGEDGKGKTTLLAEFALRSPARTIATFARSMSRHAYDYLYLLTDLCEQLHWHVYGEARAVSARPPDDGEYGLLLNLLEGRARAERRPYYFLVDGLEEIPDEDAPIREQLFGLIPFGRQQFRFLYAGRPGAAARIKERVRLPEMRIAPWPLMRFTFDETRRYFAQTGLADGQIRDLLDVSNGLPVHLEMIRQVLQGGVTPDQLMVNMPKELSGLFAYQWRAVTQAAPGDKALLEDALAFLAYDRSRHTLRSLARLTGVPVQRLARVLASLSFVRMWSGHQEIDKHLFLRDTDSAHHAPEASAGWSDLDERGKVGNELGNEIDVAIAPDAFRAYASSQLTTRERSVQERVAADLEANPLSEGALTHLPTALDTLGRLDDLIEYLSPTYFVALIEQQRPLSDVLAAASRGMRASARPTHEIDLARFSLTRALLLELGRGSVGVEEVEAYMALNAENKAVALALSVPLVEDRLELLATVAKARRLRGKPIVPEMQEQLESLAARVDAEALGERATAIGEALLFSAPNVALRFLDRAAAGTVSTDGAAMRPSRSLAIEADLEQREWLQDAGTELEGSDRSAPGQEREIFEFMQASLHDPLAQRLAGVLSVVYGNYSADEVLSTTAKLIRPQDQVFVLRMWLRRNAMCPDTVRVIERTLDLVLLHSDEVAPSAATFRDITTPLPELANPVEAARLAARVDTIANQSERQGPSRDYVRLQLQLARAEGRYDADKCHSRVLMAWYFAIDRADVVERAACVAQIVSALEAIQASAQAASQHPPIPPSDVSEMETELAALIERLLDTCSDQYHAVRGVITAIASVHPERALALATRLNTQRRRQMATLDVLRRTISKISSHRLESIVRSVGVLESGLPMLLGTVEADMALLHIAKRVASLSRVRGTRQQETAQATADDAEMPDIPEDVFIVSTAETLRAVAYLLPYLEKCRDMIGGSRRIRALTFWEVGLRRLAARVANTPTPVDEQWPELETARFPSGPITAARLPLLIKQAASAVDSAWEAIDPSWSKVSLGFEIARLLAPVARDRAQQYLTQAETARRDLRLPTANARIPYVACLWLAGRAFAGLLDQRLETDADMACLRQAIEVLPSWGERAAAWADIAVRCFLRKRDDLGRKIVVNQIHKLLDLVSDGDALLRRTVIAASAPALYLASQYQETARQWIAKVPRPQRDVIYAQIADMLITQTPPSDPFNPGIAGGRPLSFAEAQELCRLIEDVEQDALLYIVVAKLADCIVIGRKTASLSREHQHVIAERVRVHIEQRLPDRSNITHEGYKLIALMQVARMEPTEGKDPRVWVSLCERARAIPNASDRANVLGHLATTTPDLTDRHAWLQETEKTIQGIDAHLNRMESYVALAHLVLRANWGEAGAVRARKWLRLAMTTAAESPSDPSTFAAQRSAIDLAHQFDEPFARELAKQFDDDPARLRHRLYALELKQKLAAASGLPSSAADGYPLQTRDAVSGATSDEIDRLRAIAEAAGLDVAALHANRIGAVSADALREPLEQAARLPLSEAYSIYVWAIENAVRRFSGAPTQARVILRPLFEAITLVTQLAPQLVEDVAARADRAARAAVRSTPPIVEGDARGEDWPAVHVGPGERTKAEQALREWCLRHPSPYLKLSDRFFGPDELFWIRLFAENMPSGCKITVLTSRQGQRQAHVEPPWSTTYHLHWKLKISDQPPPPTEIVILGTQKDGVAPFHDRRIVCAGAGLQLGASFNGLGGASDTTITALTPEQLEDTERDLDEWARGGAWEYKGERLLRTGFVLDDPDA